MTTTTGLETETITPPKDPLLAVSKLLDNTASIARRDQAGLVDAHFSNAPVEAAKKGLLANELTYLSTRMGTALDQLVEIITVPGVEKTGKYRSLHGIDEITAIKSETGGRAEGDGIDRVAEVYLKSTETVPGSGLYRVASTDTGLSMEQAKDVLGALGALPESADLAEIARLAPEHAKRESFKTHEAITLMDWNTTMNGVKVELYARANIGLDGVPEYRNASCKVNLLLSKNLLIESVKTRTTTL